MQNLSEYQFEEICNEIPINLSLPPKVGQASIDLLDFTICKVTFFCILFRGFSNLILLIL